MERKGARERKKSHVRKYGFSQRRVSGRENLRVLTWPVYILVTHGAGPSCKSCCLSRVVITGGRGSVLDFFGSLYKSSCQLAYKRNLIKARD